VDEVVRWARHRGGDLLEGCKASDARNAGVDVEFVVDDLTRLEAISGRFDLLVDYGTFDHLGRTDRAAYVRQVVPLAGGTGVRFLLWCFGGSSGSGNGSRSRFFPRSPATRSRTPGLLVGVRLRGDAMDGLKSVAI
jgi:hypothetical protein